MSRDKEANGLPSDLGLEIAGKQWPWSFSNPRIKARGIFDGTLGVNNRNGELALAGDARLLDLHATGEASRETS